MWSNDATDILSLLSNKGVYFSIGGEFEIGRLFEDSDNSPYNQNVVY